MHKTPNIYRCISSARRRCKSGVTVSGARAIQCLISTRGLQTLSRENSSHDAHDLPGIEADSLLGYEHDEISPTSSVPTQYHVLEPTSDGENHSQAHQDTERPKIRKHVQDYSSTLDDPRVKLYVGSVASRYPDIDRLLVHRRELHVILNNGSMKSFDPLFLRDSCRCPACVDEHSGQKKFDTTDIPPNLHIRRAVQLKDGYIHVYWTNDVSTVSNEHFTSFSPSWLIDQMFLERRYPRNTAKPWERRQMGANFIKVDYRAYMETDNGYHNVLGRLNTHGLVVIENVPEDDKMVERIGERIGPLRHTFYGRTWDVKDKPKAENVAYTSGYLGLHMDLLYMKEPPGLQLLHCIKTAGTGGESIFSDALQAASIIEKISPDTMEILSSFPVAYHYTKGGHHFQHSKPVFEISPYHDRKHNASLIPFIQNTNWSPPFQGPFRVDIGLKDHGTRLQNWHRAARAFDQAVNHPGNLFQYRLKEGECVIFNNRRVLHGRTAFTSGTDGAVRWLKGAYLDHDDFRSQLRVMQRTRKRLEREIK